MKYYNYFLEGHAKFAMWTLYSHKKNNIFNWCDKTKTRYRDTVCDDLKMFALNRSVVILLKAHILTSEMYSAL